jgi:hypothetical protein
VVNKNEMKKNRYLLLITLIIILITNSCGIAMRVCHKSINRLKKETVPFSSLPVEIKDFFYYYRNIPDSKMQGKDELFTCNTTYEYECQYIDMRGGSDGMWIACHLLIDKTNNITYRLSILENVPTPVIVYDREIFIPTAYNPFTTLWYYERGEKEFTFKRYFLESDRRFRRDIKKNEKNAISK